MRAIRHEDETTFFVIVLLDIFLFAVEASILLLKVFGANNRNAELVAGEDMIQTNEIVHELAETINARSAPPAELASSDEPSPAGPTAAEEPVKEVPEAAFASAIEPEPEPCAARTWPSARPEKPPARRSGTGGGVGDALSSGGCKEAAAP